MSDRGFGFMIVKNGKERNFGKLILTFALCFSLVSISLFTNVQRVEADTWETKYDVQKKELNAKVESNEFLKGKKDSLKSVRREKRQK